MTTPAALEDLDWPTDALNWLEAYAWSGLEFTADDLRKSVRPHLTGTWSAAYFRPLASLASSGPSALQNQSPRPVNIP